MILAFLSLLRQATLTKALGGLQHDATTNLGDDWRFGPDHADVRM
jgi:hypothetical protein